MLMIETIQPTGLASSDIGRLVDSRVHAAIARNTLAISPVSLTLALTDWAMHLAASPGKRLDLLHLSVDQQLRYLTYLSANHNLGSILGEATHQAPNHDASECAKGALCVTPPSFDKRFKDPAWQNWPFNALHQGFLLADEWWRAATRGVTGVSKHHEHIVSFVTRQWLDVFSPGNFLFTNPLVLGKTAQTWGRNLVHGSINALEDLERITTNKPPAHAEVFKVGTNLALTPGKVILKNRLAELIQYLPATSRTYPEPVLIIPAWIMKYYILDLSPTNSLIEYLVSQGHTVFCLSWKNPGIDEKDLDLEDYLEHGFYAALHAINAVMPGKGVHATGYCLGGTLLAIAAAAMARDHDDRLASITLFTAQTDFRESGELALFIDESEVSLLEAQMNEAGYLSAGQMAGAFQMLRSNDLMWSRMITEYLMGERAQPNELMAWNADTTRMPARMHSRYLRELFLNNALSEGRYKVKGEPVTLFNVKVPIFCVATSADHVAPWGSVFKLHYLTPAEVTFVLASGGHNAGIVSSPSRRDRTYQIMTRPYGDHYVPHQAWLKTATRFQGSWWPAWTHWLKKYSGSLTVPPAMGAPLAGYAPISDAPGEFVHGK